MDARSRSRAPSVHSGRPLSSHCTLDALQPDTALAMIRDHFEAVVGKSLLPAACPADLNEFCTRLSDGVFLERVASVVYLRVMGAKAPEPPSIGDTPAAAAARFDKCVPCVVAPSLLPARPS